MLPTAGSSWPYPEQGLRIQVRTLIGEIAASGRCEMMADLAVLYPAQVLLTLFGLSVPAALRTI